MSSAITNSLPANFAREREGPHGRLDWRDLAICAVLCLVTLAIYIQAAGFDFVDYDDGIYVTSNWHVQRGLTLDSLHWAFTTDRGGYWHPLTLLCYLVISTLLGPRAGAFHVVNILIHFANVALLYVVLLKLTGSRWQSAIVAALWAWHPLRVESVAWISELKDVLCGFFWLCCLLAYARYRRRPTIWRYAIVAAVFLLALMSKPMAVTLPLVLLLLDHWPLRLGEDGERGYWRKRVLEKLPLLVLSAAIAAVTVILAHAVGAAGSLRYFPIRIRITNALLAYISYLGKTFWPMHLSAFYPHSAMLQQPIPALKWITAVIVLLLVTSAAIFQWRSRPYIAVGWFWFVCALVPVIGLVQSGQQAMADRFCYLPGIGLTIVVVWWMGNLAGTRHFWQRLLFCLGAAACTILAAVSFVQVGYWRNSRTLFSHAYRTDPSNYLALENLSTFALADGKGEQAIGYAQRAIELAADDPGAHDTLAQALQVAGRRKEAMREFKKAITLNSREPLLRNELGGLLMQEQRFPEAIEQFREAIRLDPSFIAARQNLAVLLANQGKYQDAIAQWNTALVFEPGNGITHGWLAEALRITGDRTGAVEHYRAAIMAGEHNPVWESNYAWLVATDPQASDAELEQAVLAARDAVSQAHQAMALDALGAALARIGRFDDAADAAKQAIDVSEAQGNIALAKEIRERLNAYRAGHPYLVQEATTRASGG